MATGTRILPEFMSDFIKSALVRLAGVLVFALGVALTLALFFHNPYLDGFNVASTMGRAGIFGNVIHVVLYGIGWLPALFLFIYTMRWGGRIFLRVKSPSPEYDAIRLFLTIILGGAGLGCVAPSHSFGGVVGVIVANDLTKLFGGTWTFILGVVFIASFLLMAGVMLHIKWADVRAASVRMAHSVMWLGNALHLTRYRAPGTDDIGNDADGGGDIPDGADDDTDDVPKEKRKKAAPAPVKKISKKEAPASEYTLPPPEFLEKSVFSKQALTSDLKRNASALEAHFEEFGVYGKVAGIKPGPVVTLYEFEPESGMRIAKIVETVKDMTRAMATENIRIAHIPRTNYIGVEMVNIVRQNIRFQSLITSADFQNSKYHIPLALGVDIGGNPMYFDLAKMPHVLIAGRTGSGKSVFVQSIIMSILYHFTADECRLVVIDPKGVDFTLWHDIPHLATPIVTDATQAVNALKWAVREMEDRYKRLKDIGVQNLEGFNAEVARYRDAGKKVTKQVAVGTDPETGALEFEEQEVDLSDMPYLVIIIDEVADLMSVARKEVEACIQRLAQKARAAGIHVVAATQRPDTTVITGVIKANFPTRISFQARSAIDSGTTLGEKGAEQLLSFGDMLFSEAGRVPVRIHGPWIENKEINRVADFLRAQGDPHYVAGATDGDDSGFDGMPDGIPGMPAAKGDKEADLYRQAVDYVVRDKKPTISYIQRRLQIGYNKAAGFMEQMEREGIVSAADANNKRHLL